MRALFLAAALLAGTAAQAQYVSQQPGEAQFRALFKEMVETDTSLTTGSCTAAAEKLAVRFKAAGYADADITQHAGRSPMSLFDGDRARLVYPLGYDDTPPIFPGSKWKVHDIARPAPTVVKPGEKAGAAPADAIILFDGKNTDALIGKEDGSIFRYAYGARRDGNAAGALDAQQVGEQQGGDDAAGGGERDHQARTLQRRRSRGPAQPSRRLRAHRGRAEP